MSIIKPTETDRQMYVRNTITVTVAVVAIAVPMIFGVGSCSVRVEQQRTIRHRDSLEACKAAAPDPQQCLLLLINPTGNNFSGGH